MKLKFLAIDEAVVVVTNKNYYDQSESLNQKLMLFIVSTVLCK